MKKLAFVIFFIGLAVGALYLVKKRIKTLRETPPSLESPLPVEVQTAKTGVVEDKRHYTGRIEPLIQVTISTRVSGYLIKVLGFEGDKFNKGDTLVLIDARTIKAKLKSLRARKKAVLEEYATRKSIYLRNKKLFEGGAVSKEELEVSKAAFEAVKAELEGINQEIKEAKVELSYATVKAPFSGIITKRYKNPGDMVMPGEPILTVECPEKGYRILVKVPQELSNNIEKEGKAYLSFGGKIKETTIYSVHPAVDRDGLSVVEIRVKKKPFGLPSGALVGVDLVVAKAEGVIVPERAILPGERNLVYVVHKGRIERKKVKVIARGNGFAVVSGIIPGSKVVVGDPGLLVRLYEGQRVEPVKWSDGI